MDTNEGNSNSLGVEVIIPEDGKTAPCCPHGELSVNAAPDHVKISLTFKLIWLFENADAQNCALNGILQVSEGF